MTLNTKREAGGFMLIEIIIVLSIMTITTYILMSALPLARVNQALTGDITELRSSVTGAQQQAINEIRSQECLDAVGPDEDVQRRCSDIGVHLEGETVIQFADTTNDLLYTPGADVVLFEREQKSTLDVVTSMTILFEANPPNVVTYVNGEVLGAGQTYPFVLRLEESTRSLTVGPYGIIENNDEEDES